MPISKKIRGKNKKKTRGVVLDVDDGVTYAIPSQKKKSQKILKKNKISETISLTRNVSKTIRGGVVCGRRCDVRDTSLKKKKFKNNISHKKYLNKKKGGWCWMWETV